MGNDAADINHDGWPDLISLDMLPEDDAVIKSSEGDDMYQTLKMRTQQYGYHYQYSRNMLFVERPRKKPIRNSTALAALLQPIGVGVRYLQIMILMGNKTFHLQWNPKTSKQSGLY